MQQLPGLGGFRKWAGEGSRDFRMFNQDADQKIVVTVALASHNTSVESAK